MSDELVCVFGPQDGQRVYLPDREACAGDHVHLAREIDGPSESIAIGGELPDCSMPVDLYVVRIYRARGIHTDRVVKVLTPESVHPTTLEILDHLLHGYRAPGQHGHIN